MFLSLNYMKTCTCILPVIGFIASNPPTPIKKGFDLHLTYQNYIIINII